MFYFVLWHIWYMAQIERHWKFFWALPVRTFPGTASEVQFGKFLVGGGSPFPQGLGGPDAWGQVSRCKLTCMCSSVGHSGSWGRSLYLGTAEIGTQAMGRDFWRTHCAAPMQPDAKQRCQVMVFWTHKIGFPLCKDSTNLQNLEMSNISIIYNTKIHSL